jgi:hypothetical protein
MSNYCFLFLQRIELTPKADNSETKVPPKILINSGRLGKTDRLAFKVMYPSMDKFKDNYVVKAYCTNN